MRIILSGGGTMGSVYPLLAVRDKMIERNIAVEFLWIGTDNGPEKEMLARENITFRAIKSGKVRRYFSLQNFIDPIRALFGIFQSLKIIKEFKPDVILSAGSFVSVPVYFAARMNKVKFFVHQQDIVPGLANKLMARRADVVTVSFADSLQYFPKEKTVLTGNPVRSALLRGQKEIFAKKYGLDLNIPTLLIVGGSTGAEKINELVTSSVTQLIQFCQIIHVTGRDNLVEWVDRDKFGDKAKRYHAFEYLYEDMADAYAMANLVVCRAGLSTLTELAALRKPIITIPIPDNQQEANATYFASRNAAIRLDQGLVTTAEFVSLVRGLFENHYGLDNLVRNIVDIMPADVADSYVNLIIKKVQVISN